MLRLKLNHVSKWPLGAGGAPVHTCMYLDRFKVPTVSQSQTSADILIKAAEGILAFNVALV